MRFWLSWKQPTEDYRPLTFPPHPQILGWWCSGEDSEGVATLCGLVEATSEDDAKTFVGISWPEADDWRFVNQVADDFVPNDRFPLTPWMKERLGV